MLGRVTYKVTYKVTYRQCAGQSGVEVSNTTVDRSRKLTGRLREELRPARDLGVNLQTNHSLPPAHNTRHTRVIYSHFYSLLFLLLAVVTLNAAVRTKAKPKAETRSAVDGTTKSDQVQLRGKARPPRGPRRPVTVSVAVNQFKRW